MSKEKYDHLASEPKWLELWAKHNIYRAEDFQKNQRNTFLSNFLIRPARVFIVGMLIGLLCLICMREN